jgi:hypothetical protein
MNRVLVCCSSSAERDHLLHCAAADGAHLERVPRGGLRAIFPSLEVELRFEILERELDAERLRGLELAGVLNLKAVRNEAVRSMIYSRIRP